MVGGGGGMCGVCVCVSARACVRPCLCACVRARANNGDSFNVLNSYLQ